MADPVTVAKNSSVLSTPVEGARKAYRGEITTATELAGPTMETRAVALREGSAWLMAVSTTGFVEGSDAGAR